MAFLDIIISKTVLFVIAFLAILTIVNVYIMYLVRKKKRESVIDSKEYKKAMKLTEKPMIKEIKVKAEKRVETLESYSPIKKKSKFGWTYWREFYLDKYHADSISLINMELMNGFHRFFVVKEKEEGFIFRGKKYLFDDEHKYYNIDAKLYMFDYHEAIALPIKRKIPVTAIKKTLESTEEIDIEYAINPSTLQRFMTAKIAEGVMKGTQLDEFFKKLQMILIVTMIAVLVHLVLFVYASGILKNVQLPF